LVRALASPSLTARLRVPLDPKEETWRPASKRAAFGLLEIRQAFSRTNKSPGENFLHHSSAPSRRAVNPRWLTGARKRFISPGTNPKNPIFGEKPRLIAQIGTRKCPLIMFRPPKVNNARPFEGASEAGVLRIFAATPTAGASARAIQGGLNYLYTYLC
jgi:hypothetical protein